MIVVIVMRLNYQTVRKDFHAMNILYLSTQNEPTLLPSEHSALQSTDGLLLPVYRSPLPLSVQLTTQLRVRSVCTFCHELSSPLNKLNAV
jgi:hypothetical protein